MLEASVEAEEAAAPVEAEAASEAVEEAAAEGDMPNLKNLKKAELAAYAEEKGIELPAKATNAEMIQIIETALE